MSSIKNRGLGKGLEALFNDVEITVGEGSGKGSVMGDSVVSLDIHQVKPNKDQPRKQFQEDKIEELANSIKTHGVLQPILVRPSGEGFEIVAGERRWRAALKAGLKEIPSIIREVSDEQNMLVALIENMQREDLNAIEEAQGLDHLLSTYGLTQEEVSKSVGKSRSYVANALRLLKLPLSVQDKVREGALSGGHARAIAGVKSTEQQIALANRCVREGWSVREIEAHTKEDTERPKQGKSLANRKKDQEIRAVEEELKELLGTKVTILHGSKKGKIEIEYYSREELDRLLDLFQKKVN